MNYDPMNAREVEAAMERTVGRLEGKMDVLIQRVAENEDKAQASRAVLYQRVDDMNGRQQLMEEHLKVLTAKVESMQPTLKKVEHWEQRGIGAAGLFTALGAVFGATVAALWKTILTKMGIPV